MTPMLFDPLAYFLQNVNNVLFVFPAPRYHNLFLLLSCGRHVTEARLTRNVFRGWEKATPTRSELSSVNSWRYTARPSRKQREETFKAVQFFGRLRKRWEKVLWLQCRRLPALPHRRNCLRTSFSAKSRVDRTSEFRLKRTREADKQTTIEQIRRCLQLNQSPNLHIQAPTLIQVFSILVKAQLFTPNPSALAMWYYKRKARHPLEKTAREGDREVEVGAQVKPSFWSQEAVLEQTPHPQPAFQQPTLVRENDLNLLKAALRFLMEHSFAGQPYVHMKCHT